MSRLYRYHWLGVDWLSVGLQSAGFVVWLALVAAVTMALVDWLQPAPVQCVTRWERAFELPAGWEVRGYHGDTVLVCGPAEGGDDE